MLVLTCLGLSSCKKWLSVKPDDQIPQDELFNTPSGVMKALNGVYLSFAEDNSYARSLSCQTVDVLGQLYSIDPMKGNGSRFMARYAYTDPSVKSTFESIWQKGYFQISLLNNFIEQVTPRSAMFNKHNFNINYEYAMGEAIAMRAMLHFDMFRIWGPMYDASTANNISLPYYRHVNEKPNPLLPASVFLDSVMVDLDKALVFLEADSSFSSPEMFENYSRNMRMNYYAVRTLQARVELYRGDKDKAYKIASELVGEGGALSAKVATTFPFVTQNMAENAQAPDRIFYTEQIFCINNSRRDKIFEDMYNYQLGDERYFAPQEQFVNNLYLNNPKDFRMNSWRSNPGNGKDIECRKFSPISDAQNSKRTKIQSVIRLGELYLIAAETAPSEELRLQYLGQLRVARGYQWGSITDEEKADWTRTILDEYIRETYGEGQYFFALKRLKIAKVPDGYNPSTAISMGPSQYVVPMPDSEMKFRENQ